MAKPRSGGSEMTYTPENVVFRSEQSQLIPLDHHKYIAVYDGRVMGLIVFEKDLIYCQRMGLIDHQSIEFRTENEAIDLEEAFLKLICIDKNL